MYTNWLVKDILNNVPVLNDSTGIYIHDRSPVGIVKLNLDNYDVLDYGSQLVDSFMWYSELNQFHIFLQ